MIFSRLIKNLQSKPYEDRIRILWMAVAILGIAMVGVWVFSLKSTIGNLQGEDLLDFQPAVQSSSIETDNLIQVERTEQDTQELKIYFVVENTTSDILNFSQLSNIVLTAEDREYRPVKILDRQNTPFVLKVLSNTKNFGIVVFEPIQSPEGVLVFDNLFFETSPEQTIKQEFNLDFKSLNQPLEIRN